VSKEDLLLMAMAVALVALVVRWQIGKFSDKVDRGEAGFKRHSEQDSVADDARDSANSLSDSASFDERGVKSAYVAFCDVVDAEFARFKEMAKSGGGAGGGSGGFGAGGGAGGLRGDVLARLDDFSRELVFIQTMGEGVGKRRWEEKLFGFLSRVDEFVLENFGQDELDGMRERLQKAWQKI